MVPHNSFEKMALLALVAILLCGVLSIRALAVESDGYVDSGPLSEDFETGAPIPEDFETGTDGSDLSLLLSEISAIRQSSEIFLYFVIPIAAAVLFVYQLCKWFCSTFVDSVL